MKRLIVSFDGTWNTPTQESNGVPCPTNVYKIHRAILDKGSNDIKQEKYYHPGVGTEGGMIRKIFDGAFGANLGEHIESGYFWLADNYQTGDEIYLFGFSRGAFTVRSLAGMIKTSGLLDLSKIDQNGNREKEKYEMKWKAVRDAYKAYRQKGNKETCRILTEFKHTYEDKFFNKGDAVKIQFLGVWDTVGAAGIPDDLELIDAIFDRSSKWEFHNMTLGNHVKIGRHAMALDEKRSSFTVTRWSNPDKHKDLKEVWFPGVHSDVGGGYDSSSLSDIPLAWMIDEAKRAGLEFHDIQSQLKPDPLGVIHNSYQGAFAALRSRPRNIPMIEGTNPCIHESVLLRKDANLIHYPDYWPTKHLEVNDPFTIDIFAKERWNYTTLYFKSDEKYIFKASGTWVDDKDSCEWIGTEQDNNFTLGDLGRGFGTLWGKVEGIFNSKNKSTDFWGTKRVETEDWFSMIGVITNDAGVRDPVKNDGSPVPHTYV